MPAKSNAKKLTMRWVDHLHKALPWEGAPAGPPVQEAYQAQALEVGHRMHPGGPHPSSGSAAAARLH
eukprot:548965-Pelagomonas_calceolata.AAC.1